MSTSYDHGVQYLPSTVSGGAITIDQLQALGISYVRVEFVDYINTLRCRVLSLPYFLALLKSARPGIGIVKACLGIVYLHMADGFSSAGEYLYAPDLSTLRICPYAPGEAMVMGYFEEKKPYIGLDNKLSVEVPLCPRTTLRRVVREASVAGVEFLVGFESEFILLKSTHPVQALNEHSYGATNAFSAGSVEAKILREIADGIQASGIELQVYHAEAALGQYEFVTGPLPPLEAADALIHTREIIYNTAAKHGLRATFAPRAFMNSAGSAAHAHISVHSKNEVKPSNVLSTAESSFLSSVLTNLPALTALTMPLPASYKRMADGLWSGGTYVNWGTENREAPVRLANASSPSSRNFEVRCVDGTANPYLALAGILGVGFNGIKTGAKLTIQDCPGPKFAFQLTEEERQSLGITQRMSLTWEEARKNLNENGLLREVLGAELTRDYLSVHKTAAEAFEPEGEDEAAALTRLVEYY